MRRQKCSSALAAVGVADPAAARTALALAQRRASLSPQTVACERIDALVPIVLDRLWRSSAPDRALAGVLRIVEAVLRRASI